MNETVLFIGAIINQLLAVAAVFVLYLLFCILVHTNVITSQIWLCWRRGRFIACGLNTELVVGPKVMAGALIPVCRDKSTAKAHVPDVSRATLWHWVTWNRITFIIVARKDRITCQAT